MKLFFLSRMIYAPLHEVDGEKIYSEEDMNTVESPCPKILFIPFKHHSDREEAQHIEHMIVFGIQEILDLFYEGEYLDLNMAKEKGEILPSEMVNIEQDARTQGFLMAVKGETTSPRMQAGRVEKKFTCTVKAGPCGGTRFPFNRKISVGLGRRKPIVSIGELHRLQVDLWNYLFKKLYQGKRIVPQNSKFFKYRLKQPPTLSTKAYRNFVIARRFCKNYRDKIKYYLKCTEYDPCFGMAYRCVGFLVKEGKRYTEAIRLYQKALQTLINPKALGEVHSELGICHIMLDNFEQAVFHWEKAIEWDFERKEAYVNLATAHEERGMLAKAISYLGRVKRIDPSYYFAHRSLGRIYITLGQWRKAVEEFLSIIQADPQNAWAHYCLGNCYYQEGVIEKAKEHLNIAVKLDPEGEAGKCASRELKKIRV